MDITKSLVIEFFATIKHNLDFFNSFEKGEGVTSNIQFEKVHAKINKYEQGIKGTTFYNSYEIKTRKTWINFNRYYQRIKIKYPIVSKIQEFLQTEYELTEVESINLIFLTLKYLLESKNNITNDQEFEKLANIFINDCAKEEIEVNIKICLSGVWLEDDSYEINKNFILRKPNNEDISFDDISAPFPIRGAGERLSNTSAVIEIKRFSSSLEFNTHNLELETQKLVKILFLYKTASVILIEHIYTPVSIFNQQVTGSYSSNFYHPHYAYGFKKSDSKILEEFIETIIKLLPDTGWEFKQKQKKYPVYLALDRYIDSISRDHHVENRIAHCVSALEALLLEGDGKGEYSHKLSQRGAYLLKVFGRNTLEVFKTFKTAYGIRSSFIHGLPISHAKRLTLKELSDRVFDFSRNIILIFLQIEGNKNDFLHLIDEAILDEDANRKLFEILNKCKFIS